MRRVEKSRFILRLGYLFIYLQFRKDFFLYLNFFLDITLKTEMKQWLLKTDIVYKMKFINFVLDYNSHIMYDVFYFLGHSYFTQVFPCYLCILTCLFHSCYSSPAAFFRFMCCMFICWLVNMCRARKNRENRNSK